MARYFFDFRQGKERCADTDGTDLANVEQAYLEAVRAAQDMWGELLRERKDPRQCAFEVHSERRELLFVLPFQEVIDNCVDRKTPPLRNIFDTATQHASNTQRVCREFRDELHAVRRTLEQSRALLRVKV
jgi:hypothetical protein